MIVDGANVVGSVPDGWWRDRAGAAVRLRDRLARMTVDGFAGQPGPVRFVLVVEGRARDIPETEGVRVERAPASGDDLMVDLVAAAPPDVRVVVVTPHRELRARVTRLGGWVTGPARFPR